MNVNSCTADNFIALSSSVSSKKKAEINLFFRINQSGAE